MYLLPDRASYRNGAPVVGSRARVPLRYLLTILPPLAPVIHLMNTSTEQ
jgi:hypothetical protein